MAANTMLFMIWNALSFFSYITETTLQQVNQRSLFTLQPLHANASVLFFSYTKALYRCTNWKVMQYANRNEGMLAIAGLQHTNSRPRDLPPFSSGSRGVKEWGQNKNTPREDRKTGPSG